MQHNHNSLKESYEKVLTENILEKDKLQQQIRNSEAMFESSPVPMFIIDDTTNIVMTNLAFAVMCGGSESDILQHRPGNSLRCVNSHTDPRGCGYSSECKFCNVRNGVEGLIANGGSLQGAELELELVRNGESGKYWVNIGVEPIMMNGLKHWCIAMDDVTERKKIEIKLLKEQTFRNSIESSLSSGIAIVDDEGRQIYVNPSFCKLFGWSAEELTGQTAPYAYWPTDQLQAIGEAFQLTLANKAPTEGFELVFIHKESTRIPVQVVISPFNEGKQRTGWLANVIDITERKMAETMFHNIINMNPMSIQIVDMEGFTIIANKAYVSLFGAVPPSDFSIFNDLQSKGVGESVLLAINGEVVHFPDMYYNVHDIFSNLPDKPVWIRVILFPLKDINGKSERFVFMHEDITYHKKAEEALARSKQLLSKAEKIGKVGGWKINIDTMKLSWTDEIYRMHEVDHHFIPDVENGLNFYTPESRLIIEKAVQRAIDFGEPFDLELEINTANKNLKSVHAIGKSDLKLRKVYGFFQDITEQKKTERSLLDLHWRFESIIKGTHIGTWEWNVQTGETILNETWAHIIGYSLNELAPINAKTLEAYTHPEDMKKSEAMLERHFNDDLSYYDCEIRMKHKEGNWIWVRDCGSVITRTNEGKPLMMFGTHSDISEQKRIEHEILLKNEELQKLNATKDKFFSIIAHDLRSPFNSIVGFSELLLDQIRQKTYEGIENYAEIIKKSSGQAIKLLMNLMQWSRLQTGRMEIIPEYFEMVDLVNEVALFIHETSHQKGIIHNKILPENATVYADKNMISTVLRNLYSNAVKFSHPGGTVTITAEEQQNELTISVNDTGVGIEKTRIDKLFLLDESNSTVGTRNEKGTGLGLILCKEFVDKNEGKIWVESEVGKGSTFYFTIPRREKTLVNNVIKYETPLPAVEIRINKLKVLIVEDDETSERLLAIQISHISETVLEAITGTEAVDICRQNPDIDLILMDIQLPEMDGYEATRQIREFNKEVIIIALTAYGFDGDREKAMKAGCNDYNAKPVSKDQLINMIQKYFSSIK